MTKNFKIYLAATTLALGMEAANTIEFLNNKTVPFSENKYVGHKVTMTDDVTGQEISFYSTKDYGEDAVVIKTPYEESVYGDYECELLFCDTNKISDNNIEFIKKYSDNQEELLKDSKIKSLISDTKSSTDKIRDCEYMTSDVLPKDNDYSVNYVTFEEDYSDKKMISDQDQDFNINMYYILSSIALGIVPIGLGALVVKEEKDKKMTKTI